MDTLLKFFGWCFIAEIAIITGMSVIIFFQAWLARKVQSDNMKTLLMFEKTLAELKKDFKGKSDDEIDAANFPGVPSGGELDARVKKYLKDANAKSGDD